MADETPKDAIFRIVVRADLQRVWRELTKTDEAQGAVFNAWLHTTGMAAGGRLQMRTGTGKHVLVVGEVLEFDPPRRFVHTHRFTQHDDPVCRVTYELKPVEGGVEVTLTVDDLPLGTKTAKGMQDGGDFILRNLKAIVENGRPPLSTRLMYWMFGAMEFVLPARSKTEHWPLEGRK